MIDETAALTPDRVFLQGTGHLGALIDRFDWSRTGLGPIESWPAPMKATIALILRSGLSIVTLWGEHGTMIYNDAYRAFAGDRHPTLLGSPILEGWPEIAHFNIDVLRKVYREGSPLSFKDQEFTLELRDGPKQLWADLEYSPVLDEHGEPIGIVAVVIDTTQKVLASQRSENDRDRLWHMTRDLLLVCRFDGVITAVNPSAGRILDWAEEDMLGRNLADFIHADDIASTKRELANLSEGVTTLSFENRYRTKSGEYRLFCWTAVPEGGRVHAVGRDITEERLLSEDRERAWNLSPVLKVVTNTQGVITDVNPGWVEALGWSRTETIGRRSIDFQNEDEGQWNERVHTLANAPRRLDYRTTVLAKDGSHRVVEWTTVPEHGTFYGFGRDITAEVEAAEALAETEAALRQSQKMEAIGQLTGGIAHDFNNLLQGISGSLEIMKRRIDQGRVEEIDRFIAGASTAAGRAASLTHRLLAFARRQPLDPKPARVNTMIASMEDLLRRTIGEEIILEFALAGDLWTTRCDPNQLETAILNLVLNARDAMPGGGKLTIETCNAHLDHVYAARQRGVRPGQYVCLSVTDTGIGMDSDTLSRAFEPFFTTKPLGQGTGLGLSMIYGFAQQSEGYAKIQSETGRGTTFKLYLPRHLSEGEVGLAAPNGEQRASGSKNGKVVLVVEDEALVRGLIVDELEELGFIALEAANGTEGVEILRSQRHIDLLVTDMGLPGLNGREVAHAGREIRPDLKILFMTGYAEDAALASGFLEHGMTMITKPFQMENLTGRIKAMIE